MLKIALCALFLVAISHALSDSEVLDQWKEFQAKQNKSYKSPIEATRRLSIFRKNLQRIQEHNARYQKGEVSYYQGVNQFTDWTPEEFNEYANGIMPDFDKFGRKLTWPQDFNLTDVPTSRDWRNDITILPPENQGNCESCWTFSSTGAVEAHLAIIGRPVIRLSKQNLVDCCKPPTYTSNGCHRGKPSEAYAYMQENGVDSEESYPYEGVDGECRQQKSVAKITDHVSLPIEEASFENVVGNTGPVSSALCAIPSFSGYQGGIYSDPQCNCQPNHAVLIIGYGEENGEKYWIIKNSWGTGWGDQGYGKLKKGENTCNIYNYGTYPWVRPKV